MKMEREIPSSLDALATLNDDLEGHLLAHGVVAERIGQVRLIVEELACNALHHGQCAQHEAPLRLALRLDAKALVLELHDRGAAFDPTDTPMPALEAELDARPIGGLGLYLVQQLADALDYRREGDANIVRVTLLAPYSPVLEDLP
ncbi:MAG TPA: ATP-binding protein [Stenotrophomonas sp.]|jgi:anti-sigma regulatory factor (Ser/Thr protein kinase)